MGVSNGLMFFWAVILGIRIVLFPSVMPRNTLTTTIDFFTLFFARLLSVDLPCHWWSATHIAFCGPVIDGLQHILLSVDLPCHWWSATHIAFCGPAMSLMVCNTYCFLWTCHVIDGLQHILLSVDLPCHWWSATHIAFCGPVMSLMVCNTYCFLWTCHVIDGLQHILLSVDLPCHWWSAIHIAFCGPAMSLMVCNTYCFLWTCHVIDGLQHILLSVDLPCHWWSAFCNTYCFLWTCHVIDGLQHIAFCGPAMSLMVCNTYSGVPGSANSDVYLLFVHFFNIISSLLLTVHSMSTEAAAFHFRHGLFRSIRLLLSSYPG